VSRVSEYLVEVYRPRTLSRSAPDPTPHDLSIALKKMTTDGNPIRLVCSIFVPDEEICFYLFEASSREAVEDAATRSGLVFDRVMAASSDCWSRM
jgi:hypothetical protein